MISLIVTIVILGLVAYCLTLLPLPEPYKQLINVVLIIVAIIYVLKFIGVTLG